MAIDVPNTPVAGDTFTAGGKTWKFNGTGWQLTPIGSTPGISATGRVITYAGLASLSPSAGDTYLVEADGMFYIYDATLGWPAQGAGISIYGTNYGVGTTFPPTPSADDRFYRTDLHAMAFFNGTNWLSEQEYEAGTTTAIDSVASISVSSVVWRGAVRGDYRMFITRWVHALRTGATHNSTNYWKFDLSCQNASAAFDSTIAQYSPTTQGANTIRQNDIQVNALLASTARHLYVQATKTGAPSNCFQGGALYYRLVLG